MGCVISACGGLKTTKLASDNDNDGESHYGWRRANGKLGVVVGNVNERELANERPEKISDNKSDIDQTRGLHCDTLVGRAEQMRTPERQCMVRLARTKEGNLIEGDRTLRTNNLSALLLTILSRSRRHSSTRIDVTQSSSPDSSLQITNQKQVACRSHTTAARPYSLVASEMVQLSEHSSGRESQPADGHRLAMSCSTPTINLDSGQHAARDQADEVSLFTSMHQLCYEIINCKLIAASQRSESSAPLCLFVFGWPGSSKGELAFELVEHSPLIDFIARLEEEDPRTQHSEGYQNNDCPLYHYLDVSSLIVANIDTRIREYNRLVAQTLRSRRQQLVNGEISSLESLVSNKSRVEEEEEEEVREEIESEDVSGSLQVDASQESRDDHEEDELHTTTSSRDRLQSMGGSDSSNATTTWPATSKELKSEASDKPDKERHLSDQFDLITLSTKQRSILQLKMIKYACCVTAKWVMHLLKHEINLLEDRLARASCDKTVVVPRRVYLVNLVPNQLSLFKSCLYLQQSLPLGQLRLPYWAVKFERRTNIKLMMNKERATALASSTAENANRTGGGGRAQRHSITLANPRGKRVLIQFKRLSQIRLPTILVATGTAATVEAATKDIGNQRDQSQNNNIGHAAANLLANGPNEKLGPKYNDLFARQFDSLNKLTRLRYNPTRNYNYSDEHDQLLQDLDASKSPSAMSTNEPEFSRTTRNTCYLKLSHLIDFESHHEPPPSPSDLSQVSSRAGSQLMVAGESNHHRPSSLQSYECATSGRLLVSPSPCPSSVTSDESFALSCDLGGGGGHRQRQQLSPAHFRFPPNIQHQQAGQQHPLKWAVELELVDEQTGESTLRWYHQSRFACSVDSQSSPPDRMRQCENDLATNCCLHVYHNDKRSLRARSHASLLAPSSLATVPATICQAENYYLVATRVAYVTGKSQAVLEAKRLHKRVIKCSSSRSDLIKLRKLISKAGVCLTRDLDTWLKESLFKQAQSPPPSTLMHGRHATKSVALITYTIRVDVSKFVTVNPRAALAVRRGQPDSVMQSPEVPRLKVDKPRVTPVSSDDGEHLGPSPSPDPIVQLLRTQPKRSSLAKQRPASARQLSDKRGGDQQELRVVSPDGLSLQLPDQNGTSRCGSSTRSSSPRQRHVQFKLGQAPSSSGNRAAGDASGTSNSQRRIWMHDNLFVGSTESCLFPIMDSLVSALKSIDRE